MQGLDWLQPAVYLVGRDDAQMVALQLLVYCLNCEVDVDLTCWGVVTIESLQVPGVYVKAGNLHEIDCCVDFKLDKRYGSSLYQPHACNPRLLLQQLL